MEVNNLETNRRAQIGNITIPLLKGEQGYSISRIVRTSGDGGAGSIDTYTVYIDTDPETAIGTFQVVNGTGGDMSKNVYDIDNDDIVDRATGDGNGNEITATYETIANVTALASRVATLEQAGYITKSVADLANYYLKSETYTKQEVNNLCDMIPKFAIEVVSVLPTQDISETTIYLLRDDEETLDVYQEYIYVNNTWERIGGQRIDLSNYYQKSETYSKEDLNGKLVNVGAEAPENGERVWFSKGRNMLPGDASQWESGHYSITGVKENYTTRMRLINLLPVKPSTTYYMSCTNRIFIVREYNANGQFIYNVGGVYAAQPFTTQSETYFLGITYDLTYSDYNEATAKLFMCENSVADKSYEPFIEKTLKVDNEDFISMDNLVSVGANQPSDGKRVLFAKTKNLLPTNKYITTVTTNGITFTNNGDGTFNIVGTATASTTIVIIPANIINLEANQSYYLYSNEAYDVDTFNLSIVMTEGSSTKFLTANHTYTPTTLPTNVKLQFYIDSGKSVNKTNVKLMLVKGNTAPDQYEPYVDEGIYVDNELWYDKSFIKSKHYSSITTSDTGYANLGLMSNEVAVIGIKHNPVESATKIELYSNQLGQIFIRVSVGSVYSARTIYNITVYYI